MLKIDYKKKTVSIYSNRFCLSLYVCVYVCVSVSTMLNEGMRKKSKALIMITNIIIAYVVFSALFRYIIRS